MHEVLGQTKVPWREGFRQDGRSAPPGNRPRRHSIRQHRRLSADAAARNPVRRGRRDPRRPETATSQPYSCRWRLATPREPTPNTCSGTRLDHRPEQHRLSAVRASLRLVSTPACRAARAVSNARFDAVDHVMTYFFSDVGGMDGFLDPVHRSRRRRAKATAPPARRTRRLRRAEQGCVAAGQGRRRRTAVVAGPRDVPAGGSSAWRRRQT